MKWTDNVLKKIRRRRFQLLPCVIGLLISVYISAGLYRQWSEIRASEQENGVLEIAAETGRISRDMIDYLFQTEEVNSVFPMLYMEAEVVVGNYVYSGMLTGVDMAVSEPAGADQIVLQEQFFEDITGLEGESLTKSEKEVLKARAIDMHAVIREETGRETTVLIAGVQENHEAGTGAVLMDIGQLKRLMNLSDKDTEITRVLVYLDQRGAAPDMEEDLTTRGYSVQYDYKEELDRNMEQQEILAGRVKLLALMVFFILLTGYRVMRT